jgi:hypothetical protein
METDVLSFLDYEENEQETKKAVKQYVQQNEDTDEQSGQQDDTIEIVIDEEADDIVGINDDETEGEAAEETDVSTEEKVEKVQAKALRKRKGVSAQDRIRDLVKEKNELKQRIEQERLEKERIAQEYSTVRMASTKVQKDLLEDRLAMQIKELQVAMEEGRHEKVVELQESMFQTRIALLNAQGAEDRAKVTSETKQQEQKTNSNVNEHALSWINEYPVFKTDPVFNAAAMAVNKDLLSKGWDAESPEFYEELTTILSKRFGDVMGFEEEEVEEPVAKKAKPQQKVASTSNTGSVGSQRSLVKNKNVVTLSKAELKVAESFGMTPKEYAKYKMQAETNRNKYGEISVLN